MKKFEELVKQGVIRKGDFTKQQADDCMGVAKRDLETSKKILNQNTDWSYNISYNAMLQSARALMFIRGYRSVGEHHHVATIRFMELEFGNKHKDLLTMMNVTRKKRNKAVNDMSGMISEKEAATALKNTKEFVNIIEDIVG